MTVNRTQDRLASFLYSAMLTSAVFAAPAATFQTAQLAANPVKAVASAAAAMRGSGWAGTASLAVPAPVAAPDAAPAPAAPQAPHALTPENATTLVASLMKVDHHSQLGPGVAYELGFMTTQGDVYPTIEGKDTADPSYGLGTNVDPQTDLIFFHVVDQFIYAYRTDRDLNLIRAAITADNGATASQVPADQAAAGLRDCLLHWGKYFKK